jgi:hypothetical protein
MNGQQHQLSFFATPPRERAGWRGICSCSESFGLRPSRLDIEMAHHEHLSRVRHSEPGGSEDDESSAATPGSS